MLKDVEIGEVVLFAEAALIAGKLTGGSVLLCDGKAEKPHVAANPEQVLASLSFREVSAAGATVTMTDLAGNATKAGQVRWFRAQAKDGATIFQGPVGVRGKSEAPLTVSRSEVLPGDRINILSAKLVID